MAFLLPALGSVLSTVLPMAIQAIQARRAARGKGFIDGEDIGHNCNRCGAKAVGGSVSLSNSGRFIHKTQCNACGGRIQRTLSNAMTRKIVKHLHSPEGGRILIDHAAPHAQIHGEGFFTTMFDTLKNVGKTLLQKGAPIAINLAKDKLLPAAVEYGASKASDLISQRFGERYGSKASDFIREHGTNLGRKGLARFDRFLPPPPMSAEDVDAAENMAGFAELPKGSGYYRGYTGGSLIY